LFKRHINKRWAADKHAELVRLNQNTALTYFYLHRKDVNEYIREKTPGITSIPKSDGIMQNIAIMEKCRLFVSNDTALMHIAAGLGIPTAAIFGYTDYRELHPWQNKHILIRKDLECSPCFFNSPRPVKCIYSGEEEFKCIKTIEVEEVYKASERLIEEIPGDVKSRYNIQ
jgi:heptosyltransferase-2